MTRKHDNEGQKSPPQVKYAWEKFTIKNTYAKQNQNHTNQKMAFCTCLKQMMWKATSAATNSQSHPGIVCRYKHMQD